MHQRRRLTAGLGLVLATALGIGAWAGPDQRDGDLLRGQTTRRSVDVRAPGDDQRRLYRGSSRRRSPSSFARVDRLVASLDIAGQSVDVVVTGMAAPTSCKVLDVVLGRIDVSRPGLVVDLDQLRLQLAAEPGKFDPTKVLGNMLCQMAKLFGEGRSRSIAEPLTRVAKLLDIRVIA